MQLSTFFLFLILPFLFFAGCTRSAPDTSKISVQLPAASTTATINSAPVQMLTSSKWQLGAPTLASEINCYAIGVTTPEVSQSHHSCSSLAAVSVAAPTFIEGGFPAGSEAVIEVPSGPGRTIYLIGFKTDDLSACTELGSNGKKFPVKNFSMPVILAEVTQDLSPGAVEISVSVASSLAGKTSFEDCAPKAFASDTLISATLTGTPANPSTTTNLNVTVAGFNVNEYQYALQSGLTCAGATYGSFVPVATPISDNISGFADGAITLCVLGKTAEGDVQALATSATWFKDTTAPLAPSAIALSGVGAIGNSVNPAFVVTGAAVGDTLFLYSDATCTTLVSTVASVPSLPATITSSTLTAGSYLFTARLQDSVGQTGPCSSATAAYLLDLTPPTTPAIVDRAFGTSLSYSPIYTWTASTDTYGIAKYKVAVGTSSGGTEISGGWTDVGLTFYFYYPGSLILTDSSTYYFSVVAVDVAGNISTVVADSYVVDITPQWTQDLYAKAGNNDSYDDYGTSVAIDGDYMVVGAPLEDSIQSGPTQGTTSSSDNTANAAGAAYVYKRVSGTWTQVAYLKSPAPYSGDWFGQSVAISKDTIAIGAPGEDSNTTAISNTVSGDSTSHDFGFIGAVYIFKLTGNSWLQEAYIKAPNTVANDLAFGTSVSIHNDRLVVGAPQEDSTATGPSASPAVNTGLTNNGAAYVFDRVGSTWSYSHYLKPPRSGAGWYFGSAVSVFGDTIAVACANEDSGSSTIINGTTADNDNSALYAGAVYVFHYDGTNWAQQAYIKATNAAGSDYFGSSLALSENRLVVGAPLEDSDGSSQADDSFLQSGAAYVFLRTGTSWVAEAYLKPSLPIAFGNFGTSVSIWGSTIGVGTYVEASCSPLSLYGTSVDTDTACGDTGAVYMYQYNGNIWQQQAYLKPTNAGAGGFPRFGNAISISGSAVAIGAKGDDSSSTILMNSGTSASGATNPDSGAVFLFEP